MRLHARGVASRLGPDALPGARAAMGAHASSAQICCVFVEGDGPPGQTGALISAGGDNRYTRSHQRGRNDESSGWMSHPEVDVSNKLNPTDRDSFEGLREWLASQPVHRIRINAGA